MYDTLPMMPAAELHEIVKTAVRSSDGAATFGQVLALLEPRTYAQGRCETALRGLIAGGFLHPDSDEVTATTRLKWWTSVAVDHVLANTQTANAA